MSKGPKLPEKKFDPLVTTLAEAQAYIKVRAQNGTACPCCTQEVKVVEKAIHPFMARTLIILHLHYLKEPNTKWVHVNSHLDSVALFHGIPLRGGDWPKLVMWGLIEEIPKTEKTEDGKRVGYYRLTPKGVSFAKGETKVPRAALIYAGRVLGLTSDRDVSIQDVLGKDFNYTDLLAGKFSDAPQFLGFAPVPQQDRAADF